MIGTPTWHADSGELGRALLFVHALGSRVVDSQLAIFTATVAGFDGDVRRTFAMCVAAEWRASLAAVTGDDYAAHADSWRRYRAVVALAEPALIAQHGAMTCDERASWIARAS